MIRTRLETMPLEELNTFLETVIIKLNLAINKVNVILKENL